MRRTLTFVSLLLIPVGLLVGCNFFSFTNPANSDKDYVAEGMQHLWDGEYEDAIASFDNALDENDMNAEAHWGRAKAYLRTSGFTSIELVSRLSTIENTAGFGQLPFMDLEIERANTLYGALFKVNSDLEAIYSGGAANEEYTPDAVALDYAAGLSVQGILMFRDTNVDGVINAQDIDLGAIFNALGDLELSDTAGVDVNGLVEMIVPLLISSSDAILTVLEDVEGINTDQLADVVAIIANDLVDEYYTGDEDFDLPPPPGGGGDGKAPGGN